MRSVLKGSGHHDLNKRYQLHQQQLKDGTAANNPWDNFRLKDGTRKKCWIEQFGLCAYSEIEFDDGALGAHLDHVEPKSKNPARTFDHTNLLLSAIDDIGARQLARQDVFGGHDRGNRYSKTDFVNPLWSDSRRYFHYGSNGRVTPALGLSTSESRRARYTIAVLNLNAPLLVNRRRHWLEELERIIDSLLDHQSALGHFAQMELCAMGERLRPFHSAVRQRFGTFGESALNVHCPNCR